MGPQKMVKQQNDSKNWRVQNDFVETQVRKMDEHYWGQPITVTSGLAMKHSATERTKELATPKRLPPSYKPARSIEWPVKESSIKFETTEALKELSKPREHKIKPSD